MNERMTAEERFNAAIALEEVDRAPVFPILVTSAPRLYGMTQGEAWRDHNKAREALLWCYREYGYDFGSKPNYYYPMLPGKHVGAPVRNLIPGKNLQEDDLYQIDERVLFSRIDYDKIASLGWNGFWDEYYPVMSGKTVEQLVERQYMTNHLYVEDTKICEAQGMPIMLGVAVDSVLMAFSLSRTLTEFTKDLYQCPDKVEAAMQASCDDIIANAIAVCKNNNARIAFVVLERGSGFYYRLPIFERFEWPFLQRYVDAFISEGITPWLHFDTDWSINLPYLKELPKGKCVCDLDGSTDIFKAKEILGGHMCISGDVPAAMLSLGNPADVTSYCKRLIDEVGDGGGFMLTTGCECPVDVKPENLRAMVETGRNYTGKKGKTAEAVLVETKIENAPKVQVIGDLGEALAQLNFNEVMEKVAAAIDLRQDPFDILNQCRSGMERVGELYGTGEYFLSELIMSADIFKNVAARLEPMLTKESKGGDADAVVIATPRGDIHDLGKDIVATLLKADGFVVHDLGVDVSPTAIADKVEETNARIVAMSALITPTFQSMKETVDLLIKRNIRNDRFVIIGGGPTTESVRDFSGADAWTLNPRTGVNMCREFLKTGSV